MVMYQFDLSKVLYKIVFKNKIKYLENRQKQLIYNIIFKGTIKGKEMISQLYLIL